MARLAGRLGSPERQVHARPPALVLVQHHMRVALPAEIVDREMTFLLDVPADLAGSAVEILINSGTVRKLIEENRLEKLLYKDNLIFVLDQ